MSTPAESVTRLAGHRVAVIGDVMLDHFVIGHVDRISPEAPVPVVRFTRDEVRLGGAANVAHNIIALGGSARLVGLVGNDDAVDQLSRALAAARLESSGLIRDPSRPTTRKVRVVTTRNQQVARVDYETQEDAAGSALEGLVGQAVAAVGSAQSVALSDYRKGVVAPAVIERVCIAARANNVPVLIDPKVPVAERYRGATVITPNHHEAEMMTQRSIRSLDDVRDAARILHNRTGASVLITWGEHGMWILDIGGDVIEERLPATAREVSDVTGAGDTVIAVIALGLAAGLRLVDAARLANLAAGLVVSRFGPVAVSLADLAAAATGAG